MMNPNNKETTQETEAARLQRKASRVREEIESQMDGVKERAHELMAWKTYLVEHPFLTMSAAFAIGYFLAPRRIRQTVVERPVFIPVIPPTPAPVEQPAAQATAQKPDMNVKANGKAKAQTPPVTSKPDRSLIAVAAEGLLYSAMAFAGQQLMEQLLGGHRQRNTGPSANGHASDPVDVYDH